LFGKYLDKPWWQLVASSVEANVVQVDYWSHKRKPPAAVAMTYLFAGFSSENISNAASVGPQASFYRRDVCRCGDGLPIWDTKLLGGQRRLIRLAGWELGISRLEGSLRTALLQSLRHPAFPPWILKAILLQRRKA
jgi:hypothetical protein